MKFAIIADVHANLAALRAVLADTKEQMCTHYAFLGDFVGYCADPNAPNRTIYVYRISKPTSAAYGTARANAGAGGEYGPGGFPQYYIRAQDAGNLEPAGHFQFTQP
jgi:hypothetical protein